MTKDFNRPHTTEQAGDTVDLQEEHVPRPLAAVWGAFLYEGLMVSSRNPERREHVLLRWQESRAELITQSCGYLDRLWLLSRDRLRDVAWPDRPFEEEVVTQFGELLGYHLILNDGELPDEKEADAVIRYLVDRFFEARAEPGDGADK